jgi:hypothetical protein
MRRSPGPPRRVLAAAVALAALACGSACNAVSGLDGLAFDLADGGAGGAAPPADTGAVDWIKRFGADGAQVARAAAVDSNGDVFLGGSFEGSVDFGGGTIASAGGSDVVLAKLGPWGNHLWSRRFGDAAGVDQSARALAVDASGALVAVGSFDGRLDFGGGPLDAAGGTNPDVFVAKLDEGGNHLWSRRFGDTASQYATGVAIEADGDVVVVGYFEGHVDFGGGPLASAGDVDVFVAKLGADGKELWSKRFGGTGADVARGVAIDAAGRVLVVGDFEGRVDFGGGPLASAGDRDVFVLALDADGRPLWSRRFGDAEAQFGKSIAADPSGDRAWIASDFRGSIDFGDGALVTAGDFDIALAALDSNGNHLLSARYGDPALQSEPRLAVDRKGEVTLTGTFTGPVDLGGGPLDPAGELGLFVAKLGRDGRHRWSRAMHGSGVLEGTCVAASPDRRVVVVGDFSATAELGKGPVTSAGGADAFAVMLGP